MAGRELYISSAWRARRFALRLPVKYRHVNERGWHTGVTLSISTTGAIIQADEPVVPTGPLVVAIPLPVVPGCLVGRGRLVRPLAADPCAHARFAIAVDRFRIGRYDAILQSTTP